MYINARAIGLKRRFNVMSRKTFEKILRNNTKMLRELLQSSFYPYEELELEGIEDEIERTIKYAIEVIRENPKKKSLILTSDVRKPRYLESPHYKNAKDVTVKSGSEAIELVNAFWESCLRDN
ncbi:MAG: hypothetical protein M1165_02210 [Candidatus Pacearchaeota archaeon]|nr:hypothetical protein [Candidatus Pacearchaeota archaeon]